MNTAEVNIHDHSMSILLPSRGRSDSLYKSVESLRSTAFEPHNIEILIAADDDDINTVNTAVELGCNAIVTERFGYSRLHLYCNLLANKARGQWMMLFNDDAVMSTKNWDSVIYNLPESILVADLESVHTAYGLCCFPVVRRWAVEVVGGFSLHTPHTDTYWQDVGRATGTIQQVPVFVMHERADITGQNNDQTRADMVADGFRSSQEYFGEHIQKLIRADIIKLTKLLDIQE